MRNSSRQCGVIIFSLLLFFACVPTAFAANQTEEDYSPLDGIAYSDCSVDCDELHYSDDCHFYRAKHPCESSDQEMIVSTEQ